MTQYRERQRLSQLVSQQGGERGKRIRVCEREKEKEADTRKKMCERKGKGKKKNASFLSQV